LLSLLCTTMIIKPLPQLPDLTRRQPAVVAALDHVRSALDDDEHAEFYWFAREYPRNYRYHLDHAAHRLRSIYRNYQRCRAEFSTQLKDSSANTFEMSSARHHTYEIYWDFEAYLNTLGAALDTLARITGLFYKQETPVSFNRLCAKKDLDGAVRILQSAQRRWVNRLKDYRDCLVHYTPIDNMAMITCFRNAHGWEVWGRLPVNPNIREAGGFRYSRQVELLRYSLVTLRHVWALDRRMGREIRRAFRSGRFPMRHSNLFFVGTRHRVTPAKLLNPVVRADRTQTS
jgi:hypothetical protein